MSERDSGSSDVTSFRPTVGDDSGLVNQWLGSVRESLTGSLETVRAYRSEANRFMGFSGKALRHTTYGDVTSFIGHLQNEVGLAPSSIARSVAALKSLFSFAERVGYIRGHNPASMVVAPKVPTRAFPETLDLSEVKALLETARKHRPRVFALIATLALTGLRTREVTALRWSDLVQDASGRVGVRVMGRGKTRNVRLRPDLVDILQELRRQDRLPDVVSPEETGPLFGGRKGEGFSEVYVRKLVAAVGREAEISRRVTPHLLRRSFATLAIVNGASLPQLAEELGHATPQTIQRYVQAAKDLGEGSAGHIPFSF